MGRTRPSRERPRQEEERREYLTALWLRLAVGRLQLSVGEYSARVRDASHRRVRNLPYSAILCECVCVCDALYSTYSYACGCARVGALFQ